MNQLDLQAKQASLCGPYAHQGTKPAVNEGREQFSIADTYLFATSVVGEQ